MNNSSIRTIASYSLNGITRHMFLRVLLGVLIVIPLFAFISRDINLYGDPAKLFLEFQYGFQRWFLFLCGLSLLQLLVADDQNVGTQSALRAAGVQPAHYIIGKFLSILICLVVIQIVMSLYVWILSHVWGFRGKALSDAYLLKMGSLSHLFLSGWLNALCAFVISAFAYLIWTLTSHQILGYLASTIMWIAGLSKIVWGPFFLQENQIWIFKGIGWIFSILIPSFYNYDLWLALQSPNELSPLIHTQFLSLQGFGLVLILLVASWQLTLFKRT